MPFILPFAFSSYINVSLIKTRCRASRRGEVFSPVGVRLPNPYENVHLCLEFAIYQTHVILPIFALGVNLFLNSIFDPKIKQNAPDISLVRW